MAIGIHVRSVAFVDQFPDDNAGMRWVIWFGEKVDGAITSSDLRKIRKLLDRLAGRTIRLVPIIIECHFCRPSRPHTLRQTNNNECRQASFPFHIRALVVMSHRLQD